MRIMSYEAPDHHHTYKSRAHLRLAALVSGGKDGTYAAYKARMQGHTIACLVSMSGRSEESHLLHHPNTKWVGLQAAAMGHVPLISRVFDSDDTNVEMNILTSLLQEAKSRFNVQGIIHGGIRSEFQRSKFAQACSESGLCAVTPLWGSGPPPAYVAGILDAGFDVIITAVSAGGLGKEWLGRRITPTRLKELYHLSCKHGFAVDFEGGEAETFVTRCPLFERRITIRRSRTVWDGYRGRFEILDATLDHNA